MNVFGERQHPEKFIPMTIKNVREGNMVTIHSDRDKKYQAVGIIYTLKMLQTVVYS